MGNSAYSNSCLCAAQSKALVIRFLFLRPVNIALNSWTTAVLSYAGGGGWWGTRVYRCTDAHHCPHPLPGRAGQGRAEGGSYSEYCIKLPCMPQNHVVLLYFKQLEL